ncbi:glycosyltransferase [Pseudescherichia sp.]|uniref:glycosyltransferase n=1 Tax=Pseudescherichia sp. TaxID=2055881 RepID=UPI0028ACABD2|nr:glycosyltransferase [Pseudescherichia sp.]
MITMKIAMILPSLAKSGPGIQVEALCGVLSTLGCSIEVFYFRENDNSKLKFNGINKNKIGFSLASLMKLRRFDVIHSHGFFPDLFLVLLRFSGVKAAFVSTMHNFMKEDIYSRYSPIKAILYVFLWKRVLSFIPNKFVFTSIAKEYYRRFSSGHLHIVSSGIDVSEIERKIEECSVLENTYIRAIELLKRQNLEIIGSTSIITSVKHLDTVVNALPHLPNHAAVFVGGGSGEKELIELAIKLKVDNRCIFTGFKANPLPYLKTFDIYAMPSSSESFGLSLFEAIIAKLPIVCRELPIYKELLGTDGLSFFDGTVTDFIKSVNSIDMHNKELAISLYNNVIQNYDMSIVASKYRSCYWSLTKNGRF